VPRGGDRERKRAPKDAGKRTKKKICIFCKDHIEWVDYKDVNLLRRFMSDRGKIRARRVSGNCAQHQRDVAVAIKTARELALLPYTQRSASEGRGGRGRGRELFAVSGPRRAPERATDEAASPEAAAEPGADADEAYAGDGAAAVEGEAVEGEAVEVGAETET
jgi:small subunit ribosomal protein S18